MALPPLTFRRDKIAPLTVEEGDGNIDNLDGRIQDLENNPPTPISISNITETSTTFTVWLSNGNSIGPLTKPVATIEFRGNWQAATGYYANNLVFVPEVSSLYFVTQNHISAPSFDDTLENSGENIYLLMIGPLGFSTLGGLEDVNFTFREPVHGDVIRFDTTISDQWAAQAEEAVVYVTEATKTLGTSDLGKYFVCTHLSGCEITFPTVTGGFGTEILPMGSGRSVKFCQRGGPLTFTPDTASVTLRVPTGLIAGTDRIGAVVEAKHVGDGSLDPNVWDLFGLLAEQIADET